MHLDFATRLRHAAMLTFLDIEEILGLTHEESGDPGKGKSDNQETEDEDTCDGTVITQ